MKKSPLKGGKENVFGLAFQVSSFFFGSMTFSFSFSGAHSILGPM
jgi:hypothetical protein